MCFEFMIFNNAKVHCMMCYTITAVPDVHYSYNVQLWRFRTIVRKVSKSTKVKSCPAGTAETGQGLADTAVVALAKALGRSKKRAKKNVSTAPGPRDLAQPNGAASKAARKGRGRQALDGGVATGGAVEVGAATGGAANGHAAHGSAANGIAANGHAADGSAANGIAANGHAADGVPPAGASSQP